MADTKKDKNNMNVIDSAVIKVGFLVDEKGLLSSVQTAIKNAQKELDKQQININMKQNKSNINLGKGESTNINLNTQNLSSTQIKSILRQRGEQEENLRNITRQRTTEQAKSRIELEKLKFEQRMKLKEMGLNSTGNKTAGAISKIPSVLGMGSNSQISGFMSILSGTGVVALVTASVIASIGIITASVMSSVLNNSNEISNKFITGNSAFVDQTTKNTMAMFGVSGVQASGINNALSSLGMSTNDLTLMTPAQQYAFMQLYSTWVNGINSIDTDKLKAFTEATQSYQLSMATSQTELQVAWTNVLVNNSGAIKTAQDNISQLYNTLIDIVNSDMFSRLINMFISLGNAILFILNILESAVSWIANIGGSSSSSSSTITNNYYSGNGLDLDSAVIRSY